MAATTRITVNPNTYTLVASGVTHVHIHEYKVGHMKLVLQTHNATAPLPDHADYIEFDGTFEFDDGSMDVYIMSPLGVCDVGVITK